MGRAPCCEKVGLKRGRWTAEEDEILMKYIQDNGEGSWRSLPKNAGLLRCGKSCRLRWLNYLRNDLKRGNISPEEEKLIIKLHSSLGNRWSLIAGHLPGRTDNEIKNYWNSHLSRRIDTFRRPSDEPLPILMNLAKLNGGGKKKGGRTSRSTIKKKIPYNKYTHRSNLVKMTNIGETLEKVDCLDGPILTNASANQEKLMDLTYQVELNEEMGNMTNDPFLERENSVVLCTNEERESEMLGPIQGLETELMCPSNTVASEVVDPSGLLTFTNNAESGFMGFNEERESGFMGFNEERESGVSNMKAINEGGDLMNTTSLVDEISEWYSLDSNSINSSFDDHEWFDWDLIGILDNHHHNPWESGEQILSWLED